MQQVWPSYQPGPGGGPSRDGRLGSGTRDGSTGGTGRANRPGGGRDYSSGGNAGRGSGGAPRQSEPLGNNAMAEAFARARRCD